ncbi:MAG: hypothetical protein ACXVBQ_14550 [Pseudobdellovibrionaceae bacterium]
MDRSSTSTTVELHVRELSQLFDSMDPSPFHEKDLDRNAEEYVVASIKELHSSKPASLVIYLDKPPGPVAEEGELADAIRDHFARRADQLRLELRLLLRRGFISLIIGVVFLGLATLFGEFARLWIGGHLGVVITEGLRIGGWVAMWHPMEVFLYEWWPVLGDRKIYQHLSRIPVKLIYGRTSPIFAQMENGPTP